MSGKGVLWTIYNLFGDVGDMRAEMRSQGQDDEAIEAATLRMVRHHCEPEVPPLEQWPAWADVPRCAYCEGTGLIVRLAVDRLGQTVHQGKPCKCVKGDRFQPRRQSSEDFTQAGKTPKAPTRFGR